MAFSSYEVDLATYVPYALFGLAGYAIFATVQWIRYKRHAGRRANISGTLKRSASLDRERPVNRREFLGWTLVFAIGIAAPWIDYFVDKWLS